jgi:hypothetical protein
MDKPEQFCDNWLNAWTGNRPDTLLSFYTQDAFYSDPANRQGLRGHVQLLPYFSKLLKFNPEWKWTAIEIIATDKGFTLKWEASIPVSGSAIIELGLDIVELANGKISRNEVYFDRTAWLNALTRK